MSAPQPPPMFPKACKHKKVFETWKFRFTPMFSQAMKHENPTNVRLPRCSWGLHMIIFGCTAHPMLLGVVDDLHFFVRTSKTTKGGGCDLRSRVAPFGLHICAVHGNGRGRGGASGLHAPVLGGGLTIILIILIIGMKKSFIVSCPAAAAQGGDLCGVPWPWTRLRNHLRFSRNFSNRLRWWW